MSEFQWQPIDTAPKDGTRILITNGTFVTIGKYLINTFIAESWNGEKNTIPVGWMPIPQPPEDEI